MGLDNERDTAFPLHDDPTGGGANPAAPTNAVLDLLKQRASVRKYRTTPVQENLVDTILAAACQAPTSSNLQAYSIVVVRDSEKRRRLAALAGGQKHVEAAPVFLAFCADLSRLADTTEAKGAGFVGENLETCLVATIDASLVGMCASVAAESLGLGTVMIGGIRNDPSGVAALLNLPERSFAVYGMCIGYPEVKPPAKPRHPASVTIFHEHVQTPALAASIGTYDKTLAEYYRALGNPDMAAETWSDRIVKHCSKAHRSNLRSELAKRGLLFR